MTFSSAPLNIPEKDVNFVVETLGVQWEKLRGKNILLTGGTGFIGKWLLSTFLQANKKLNLNSTIVVLSRNPESFLEKHPDIKKAQEIKWIKGDIKSLVYTENVKVDFIIHAATDVVAVSSHDDIFDTCVEGTKRVIEIGLNNKSKLLLLSSGAVYGQIQNSEMKIPENWSGAPDPLLISSAYGEGKRASELLCCVAANENSEFKFTVARCFAFVGPHLALDKHFAIGNFINSVLQNKDIEILGDGTPLRSYLYASDLAIWLWTLLFEGQNRTAYNVGGSEAISIKDLAYRVKNLLGGNSEIRIAKTPPKNSKPIAYVPSLEKINRDLNLKQNISLDDAILLTANWAKNSRENDEY